MGCDCVTAGDGVLIRSGDRAASSRSLSTRRRREGLESSCTFKYSQILACFGVILADG